MVDPVSGAITYSVASHSASGEDGFEYQVCDLAGDCNVGMVLITVTAGAQNRVRSHGSFCRW